MHKAKDHIIVAVSQEWYVEVESLQNIFSICKTIQLLASFKELSTKDQTIQQRTKEINSIIEVLIWWQQGAVSIIQAPLSKYTKQATLLFFFLSQSLTSFSIVLVLVSVASLSLLLASHFATWLLTHPSFILTATPSRNNNLFLCSAFTLVIYPAYSQDYKPENTVLIGHCLPAGSLVCQSNVLCDYKITSSMASKIQSKVEKNFSLFWW